MRLVNRCLLVNHIIANYKHSLPNRKTESMQGTRLLCLADFHLGSDASVLLRHDLLSTDPVKKAMPNPLDNRPPPPPPRTRKGSNFPLQVCVIWYVDVLCERESRSAAVSPCSSCALYIYSIYFVLFYLHFRNTAPGSTSPPSLPRPLFW